MGADEEGCGEGIKRRRGKATGDRADEQPAEAGCRQQAHACAHEGFCRGRQALQWWRGPDGDERDEGDHAAKGARADQRRAPADRVAERAAGSKPRSEEHTSELQSLMRISYAVFCLKKKKKNNN